MSVHPLTLTKYISGQIIKFIKKGKEKKTFAQLNIFGHKKTF